LEDSKVSKKRIGKRIMLRTKIVMIVCGVLMFIPLVYQLYTLQIKQHEVYQQQAINQQTRDTTVEATRGTIYDRNYKSLASSASVESIYIAPVYIESDEQAELIARGLSDILGLSYDSVYEKTTKRTSYYQRILRKVEKDLVDQVRKFKSDNSLKAIQIEPDTKRYYTYSTLAAQLIGFVGVDNDGLDGLESYYNKTLSGTPGMIISLKNAKGSDMPESFETYYDAEDGLSLVLTIDLTIQQIVEKYLEEAVEEYDIQDRGAAIAMDVKTGEVLAMATTGGVDLNAPREVSEESKQLLSLLSGEEYTKKLTELQFANWRNKTVSDTYDPGSIFKLITCSMALEEHVVTLDSSFTCTGSIRVEGRPSPINCWKRAGHGTQTLAKALQNSCNPAFVQIGLRVGAEKFYAYLKNFGFGSYTGIDVPGEANGILHDYNYFLKHNDSLAVAAFGQTFTVTPIQMISAVSAVVNGGNLMTPHVVKEYLDSEGNLVKEVQPTVVRQVISESTSKTMCELMESVVAQGTGRNAQVAGYRIGGKTATSEKSLNGKYIDGKYVVSFMAVAPMDDPQIALLVLLDTPGDAVPTTQRSGGFLAAPTAGKMLKEILPYMGIVPSFTGEEMFGAQVTVPQLTGYSLENVKKTLDGKKVAYKIVGDGQTVTGQLPAAGATITSSSELLLYCGSETDTAMVTVPNVIGMSPEKANKAITNAGLYMLPSGALAAQTSTVTAASQDIAGGTQVQKGTIIGVVFKDSAVSDYAIG